jgi:hypothetical protein
MTAETALGMTAASQISHKIAVVFTPPPVTS